MTEKKVKNGKIDKIVSDILSYMLVIIIMAIPLGAFLALIIAFMFSYEPDGLRKIFWWSFGIIELVVFPLGYLFGHKLPRMGKPLFSLTDFIGNSSRRGIRHKGYRIRKYDPEGWKKKDGDKIFY